MSLEVHSSSANLNLSGYFFIYHYLIINLIRSVETDLPPENGD